MDLDIGIMKCEPEELVKSEPLSTEPEYSYITFNNIVKTECESVSPSSSTYACSSNDDTLKQECKCFSCMEKQLAVLPKMEQCAQVDGLSSIEHAFREESQISDEEHGQENAEKLLSTKNSASCNQTRKRKTRTEAQHYCPYCNQNFTRRDSFNIHLRRKHSKNNPDLLMEPFNDMYFTCDICNFKSSCSRSFKSHMLMHETFVDNNIFKCNKCDYESCNKCSIHVHIRRKHRYIKAPHSCRFCKKTFCGKRSLVDHLLCHHDDKFDKSLKELLSLTIKHCNLCDFRIYSKGMLIKHIQRKHSNDRFTYSCKFCNKTMFQKETLAEHLLCLHGDKFDKSLKTLLSHTIKHCKLCDFRVVRKSKLNQHMTKHGHSLAKADTDAIMFKCNNCVYQTFQKCNFQAHMRRMHSERHTYLCRFCNKTFFKKVSFADHLLLQHGENFDKSLKTLFSLAVKHCQVCDFKTISKPKLNEHVTKQDHILVKADADAIIFKCNNCDYETFEKRNLRAHTRRMHSERHTYSCRFCNKTFTNKESLADHLLCKHAEKFDKSLKTLFSRTIKHCKLCDFRVINKNVLNNHIQRQHSNDRLTYSCRFCNKTVFNKAALAAHLLYYHGDKFDKSLKTLLSQTIQHCKFCDFRAVGKTMLNKHIQRKHSDDRPTYTCTFCNKTLCYKSTLANHLLSYHGSEFDRSLKTLFSLTIKHCKLCDFRTIINRLLTEHMETHGE